MFAPYPAHLLQMTGPECRPAFARFCHAPCLAAAVDLDSGGGVDPGPPASQDAADARSC